MNALSTSRASPSARAPLVRPAAPVADWAALRLLNQFRLLVITALAGVYYADGAHRTLGERDETLFEVAHLGWFVLALGFTYLIRVRKPSVESQLYLQSYLDLLCIATLMFASGGIQSGLAPLIVIGLALLAQLLPTRAALLFAAIATLVVMVEELLSRVMHGPDAANLEQAALLGASLFLVAWLLTVPVRRLISRDISVPTTFRAGLDVNQIAQLNEEIVQELDSGVVVVDAGGDVQLINDTARALLGVEFAPLPMPLARLCPALHRDLRDQRHAPGRSGTAVDITASGQTALPRYIPLSSGGMLVKLDDHGQILHQFQQLKLASLGRLSASIAHEIRNPLGAISHAVQLVQESDALTGTDADLLDIARHHTKRIDRIVDDVLQVSNRTAAATTLLDLSDELDAFRTRFLEENALETRSLSVTVHPGTRAMFDAGQLDQVLWNLCTNARLHNDERDVTIAITAWSSSRGAVVLDVVDDGRGIDEDSRARMFEPFHTTHASGSGLGPLHRAPALRAERRRHRVRAARGRRALPHHPDRCPGDGRMTNRTALVIDDEPDLRALVAMTLDRLGIDTHTAANLAEARNLLAHYEFDVCLTDMRLPDGDGVRFVGELAESHPGLPVAVITAHGQMDSAVEAMKLGAYDFVSKPVDLGVLRKLVTQAMKPRGGLGVVREDERAARTPGISAKSTDGAASPSEVSVGAERRAATQERPRVDDRLVDGHLLVGASPPMMELRAMISKVARTNAPIWITGESGTGKELIAKLIHRNSTRADGPFVAINCGAVPGELMESEFFGHRKGAFTGAHSDNPGLFRSAEGGTLFLDEIAELPLHMQVKLLRAIQERSVRAVGETQEKAVDVRILSASHVELAHAVTAGRFRQDLYYRLNVITVRAPSLRERTADLPALIECVLERLGTDGATSGPTEDALDDLRQHTFPGNVRELENVLERALAMTSGRIDTSDLALSSRATATEQSRAGELSSGATAPSVEPASPSEDRIERRRILSALQETRWNRKKAAAKLGITYRQLRYRIQQMGLEHDDDAAA